MLHLFFIGWEICRVDGLMRLVEKHVTVRFSESRLRTRNEALSILLELSNFLASAMELESLLQGALTIILRHFSLDAGRIYLWDSVEQCLVLEAHQGLDIWGLERVHLDEGFSGKSVRTKSFMAQHVSELVDKKRTDLLARKGLQIIICVPFIVMDRVEGVMNLGSKKVIKLGPEEIDLLMTMGHQIGVASCNARIYQDLQEKLREVQEKKETIKYFAYSASHDLKSPAIGLCGLMERFYRQYGDLLDDTGRLYCKTILKTAGQIATLAEQINSFIATREVPLSIGKVNMEEMLTQLRQEFDDSLQERNVALLEPSFFPVILGDELRLTRAFRNLLDNALKYGGEGLSEIRFAYEESEYHHIFSVSDNGVGIREEDINKLFHFFQRLETSSDTEGSGMGLAIAKEAAKKHLGDVWVESLPYRGATFYLSISKRLETLDTKSSEKEGTIF
ncbi:MAG: GAF domain-containing protein [Desulfobacterales bacterium]|nr:GAF domain-containing protein [Desulfobacterales bacterium]